MAPLPCQAADRWPGPDRLDGGINKRHPDGRDLERASRLAAGISRKVWQNEAVVSHVGT